MIFLSLLITNLSTVTFSIQLLTTTHAQAPDHIISVREAFSGNDIFEIVCSLLSRPRLTLRKYQRVNWILCGLHSTYSDQCFKMARQGELKIS